jgi:hypothetical protein
LQAPAAAAAAAAVEVSLVQQVVQPAVFAGQALILAHHALHVVTQLRHLSQQAAALLPQEVGTRQGSF